MSISIQKKRALALKRVEQLPAFRLVQSSGRIKSVANWVMACLIVAFLSMFLLPWQQAARGSGRVISFVPQERQQTVKAPIKGIVAMVSPGLREGDRVSEGDVILELQPAAVNLQEQLENQKLDLNAKRAAAQFKIELYQQQAVALAAARDFAVASANEMVESSRAKLDAKRRLVPGYEAKKLQAQLNYDRQVSLRQDGAVSEKEVERLKRDLDVAVSDLESALLEVTAAEKEVESKLHELEQKRNEAQSKVDAANAYEQEARGEIATVSKDVRDLEIKLSELQQQVIKAPRSGTIFRLPVFERGQTVKEGDELFTIVPETKDLAVELWINGVDVPLVHLGDHVRLQFEGWPAAQMVGWPSVAIGTFGAQVVAIDEMDDGTGKFRIQVLPIADDTVPWPDGRYLRQGVRANGWVMLGQVPLGFELWRRINGFPQSIPSKPKEDESKPPKIKVG